MVPIEAKQSEEPEQWLDVCQVDEIAPGMVFAPDEGALLLTHAGGEVHAFRNGCGNGPLALHMGRVADGTKLVCPWHIACIYDLETGISGEPPDQRRLIRYPIRVAGGTVQVAFNKAYSPPQTEPAPSAAG
jgi:nitrite reductase/ring-hydroxylating ferredoxin subunit